jgi:hypothetical protein
MLYFSGSNDTLKDLQEKEGFEGSLAEYQQELATLNPELFGKLPKNSTQLPAYTPLYLVTLPRFEASHADAVMCIVSGYEEKERKVLRALQEDKYDIPTHVATGGILEEFQAFLISAKNSLNAPIVKSDFDLFNRAFPRKGLVKISGESLKHTAKIIQESPSFNTKTRLFELMRKRDALNHGRLLLKGQKAAAGSAAEIERQIKELTAEIKKLLPKKISESKYVHGLTPAVAKKLRHNASSLKLAKKGLEKINATHLDRLTVSGLAAQRRMVKALQFVGDTAKKGATYLTYGLAAISIADAIAKGEDALRATFKEVSGIGASTLLSGAVGGGLAGLGGFAIGAVAGDITLGATILICYPIIGWVVLAVAGLAVASYFSSETKELSGKIYDGYQSGYIDKKASEFFQWIYEQYVMLGQYISSENPAGAAAIKDTGR